MFNQNPKSAESGSQSAPTAKLPGPIELLREAWLIYKEKYLTLIGIMALQLVPILAFVVLILLLVALQVAMGYIAPTITLLGLVLLALAVITLAIAQIWGQIALLLVIEKGTESPGIIDSYRQSWNKVIGFAWVTLLSGLAMAGGFIFFAIPGMIFSIWLAFASYVFLFEKEKGMNALLKSREYVRGRWWEILWRYVFASALAIVLSAFFSFLRIPSTAANIAFFVLSPLFTAYYFLIYKHAKETKGGFIFTPAAETRKILVVSAILAPILIAAVAAAVYFNFQSGGPANIPWNLQ